MLLPDAAGTPHQDGHRLLLVPQQCGTSKVTPPLAGSPQHRAGRYQVTRPS